MTIEIRIAEVLTAHRIERCSVSGSTESYQWGRCTGCDFESEYLPIKGVNWDELAHDIGRFHAAEVLVTELFPLITTVAELDALPVGTVVVDDMSDVMRRENEADGWTMNGYEGLHIPILPARVIVRPERSEP